MIPFADAKSLKRIDERAESEFGISLLQMMEVAGTRMAEFLREKFPDLSTRKVLVIAGKGNNGGDGFVCARVLKNWGVEVQVLLAFPKSSYKGVVRQNLATCIKHEIECGQQVEDPNPDIIIDCLFGFGFQGELSEEHLAMVHWANRQEALILSCDLPSGMNVEIFDEEAPCMQASYTLTFTLPKEVFRIQEARQQAGEIYILDVGIPKALYETIGIQKSLFRKKSWVRW